MDDPVTSRAPLLRRLAALLYESMLLGAVVLVAGFLFAPAMSPASSLGMGISVPALPARVLLFAVLLGVGALYCGWFWTAGRRTLPMQTWHIRLATRDGANVSWDRALLRYVAAWIGPALALVAYLALRATGHGGYALWLCGIGFAWALVDPEQQFLHDRIAGTRLVGDAAPTKIAINR